MNDIPSYFKYWGKAKKDPTNGGADYHLLVYHCLDVAAVGMLLLAPEKKLTRDLADFLSVSPKQLQNLFCFMLVLHDLGKFASAFQQLYLHNNDCLLKPRCRNPYDGKNFRHDRMGLFFWDDLKTSKLTQLLDIEHLHPRLERKAIYDSLMVLVNCVLGHHGQPINTKNKNEIEDFTESHNTEAAQLFVEQMFELLQPDIPLDKLLSVEWRCRLEQVSWQLAGIAVLSDWIGSDNEHFKYRSEPAALDDYWQYALLTAGIALQATDLNKIPKVRPFLSIKQHYGYEPTPLQQWAEQVDVDDSPQLFILEDVTGAGKTEAALALTHRLMHVGAADGFYFGLPTMATSNAMFKRIATHYGQMLAMEDGKQPSIVLAHGAREMNDLFRDAVLASKGTDQNYEKNDTTATAQCNEWLADSRKKALLAPVGVGTIDQALLAVLPRRHQSLRLLGLNRKVLIFDEVHAADEFMFELLESLLAMHLHQGGSVILLTATLSQKQRKRLVAIWHNAAGITSCVPKQSAFPLATKVSINPAIPLLEQPLKSRVDVSREVKIKFLHKFDDCIETILNAVTQGKCVVWVRNTVNDALDAFQSIQQKLANPENVLLFHSRFVLQDRKDIESRVLEIFGKYADSNIRRGKILISTQVFQESLDADADLMISDICPIDDLIQRAGRLHRHTRDINGKYQPDIIDTRSSPELWLHAPQWQDNPQTDWLSANFINTQYVYRSPGRLWLGMRELITLGAIRMPAEARQLIEAVYGEDSYEQIPATLRHQENTVIGNELSLAAKAKAQLLQWDRFGYTDQSAIGWYEDNTEISTRHSDLETVEVLLLKQTTSGSLLPWNDDTQFAVQLSTVKLSKNKYADKLAPIPAHLESALALLEQRYKQIKYLQCWLPELDPNFIYHSTTGFCEKSPLVRGTS
ncbi:CRISPR-associated helicase Cas3' [Flavobacterium sp. W21_SRS_FM6]|uniref:CRISPR-associated helicase Cas3' n=1 Tax=Flavobacterium sp. W21_SRS_FM6 TaxID=3240268 RepID=UPI003F8F7B22